MLNSPPKSGGFFRAVDPLILAPIMESCKAAAVFPRWAKLTRRNIRPPVCLFLRARLLFYVCIASFAAQLIDLIYTIPTPHPLNMSKSRLTRYLGFIAVPTLAAGYGVHLGLTHLETKYPALSPESAGSKALRIPAKTGQHCAYTDIYAARVPLRALEARARRHRQHNKNNIVVENNNTNAKVSREEIWAQSLLSSLVFRVEGSIIGLFTNGKYSPGDLGEDGFSPIPADPNEAHGQKIQPRVLVNGVLTVQREPVSSSQDGDSNGLLVSWTMADPPRLFFEKIARLGYPWRLMSGGRHEMSVSEPFEVDDNGSGHDKLVEVRFATSHDYEIVEAEGNLEQQKLLPRWSIRMHRGYARLILDRAVRELKSELNDEN